MWSLAFLSAKTKVCITCWGKLALHRRLLEAEGYDGTFRFPRDTAYGFLNAYYVIRSCGISIVSPDKSLSSVQSSECASLLQCLSHLASTNVVSFGPQLLQSPSFEPVFSRQALAPRSLHPSSQRSARSCRGPQLSLSMGLTCPVAHADCACGRLSARAEEAGSGCTAQLQLRIRLSLPLHQTLTLTVAFLLIS